MKKRFIAMMAIAAMTTVSLSGCSKMREVSKKAQSGSFLQTVHASTKSETVSKKVTKTPKYVFLFIGDGMSYPQVQLTNYYISAVNQDTTDTIPVGDTQRDILRSENQLTMMDFAIAGSAQTYDSTSFAPDSASTATSIATGKKTWSGSINVSEDFSQDYETITEKLKNQKDYKIGIISSVNLNHATPAAFYAHQVSRNSYYEIGLELIDSGFDYFAGGALKKPTGSDGTKTDLYTLAKESGYKVIRTQAEAEKLTAADGKVIVIDEHLADSDAMSYDIDRADDEWALADYVEKGIEVLDNDNGFFMMVEGGKIDWACHANDAGSTIADTLALDHAVQEAVDFYKEHPDETLIIVTGDHETGGLTIGYAGTDYDTFLTNIENQKISYAKYDSEYVSSYKANNTKFKTVLKDIEELFGLKAPTDTKDSTTGLDSADVHKESSEDGTLVMTNYEYEKLYMAYKETMLRNGGEVQFSQADYIAYGSYEPLTVTITHILNNKSGINFASYAHTGLPVEVLAEGVGAMNFDGYYDNTDIYNKLAALTGVK